MLQEQKIKLMTKLAIYENNIGKEDMHINEYFKQDYVLINNLKTRIAVTIACLFLFSMHAVIKFFRMVEEDVTIDFVELGIYYLVAYVIIIVAYTFLSTIISSRRYKEAQLRLSGYKKVLKKIDEYYEK